MNPLIVVNYLNEKLDPEEFENAELKIIPPGLLVITSETGKSGMIPIGAVAAVLFPEGESKVQGIKLT